MWVNLRANALRLIKSTDRTKRDSLAGITPVPENCRLIQVFVSSPSDVSEERSEVDTVVARTNAALGDKHGFHVETWKWEKNARPRLGKGDLPQRVVDGRNSSV